MWSTQDQQTTLAAGARTNIDLLAGLELAGASTLGCTVMRTHIRMQIQWAAAQALSDSIRIGVIVDRDTDVGAGSGPNPSTEPELDWAYLTRMYYGPNDGQAVTVQVLREWELDLKAKRKVGEQGQRWSLVLMSAAGATSFNVNTFARTLIALP